MDEAIFNCGDSGPTFDQGLLKDDSLKDYDY